LRAVSRVDELVAALPGGFSGAVLVRSGGAEFLHGGFGHADRERRIAATPNTAFQLASLSKQFTAAATLVLAGRGELAVDDSVARWFPGLAAEWEPVTVHHLLTNTAGLGHWQEYPEIDLYRATPLDDLLELVFSRPPAFVPGTRWHYSSLGFVLLARIVELCAQTEYAEFLEQQLFAPLGMAASCAGTAPAGATQAVGYSRGRPVPSFELVTVSRGAGDVWSTTADLDLWSRALASGSLPTGESIAALTAPRARVSEGAAYGYACFVGTIAGRSAVYHAGDNRGFRAFGALLPDDDVYVAVLSNDDHTAAEAIGVRLVEFALGA
jgi:CubicO group peptidase (beta-lactamase class C family)